MVTLLTAAQVEAIRARAKMMRLTCNYVEEVYGGHGTVLEFPCESYKAAQNDIPALVASLTAAREALRWALPLAEQALEDHRQRRLMGGHTNMRGKNARGAVIVGLTQQEIDAADNARAALGDE